MELVWEGMILGMTAWLNRPITVRPWLIATITRLLTKPLRTYELRVPNNLDSLKSALRMGDVLLVEGDQRISQVIRYLTQSSWSHAALYVGDALRKSSAGSTNGTAASRAEASPHMLVEAVVGAGVIASPIEKYQSYNIRVCRPQRLTSRDLDRVLADVIGHLGDQYDVQHVLDLARYFLPVTILPRRWRAAALHFGHGSEREVICSSMIAKAFSRVGYPIHPQVTVASNQPTSRPPWWRRLVSRNGYHSTVRFRELDPSLITPRDFDLSPYFEIVKFNHLADARFDYRNIVWDPAETPPGPTADA